MRPREIYHLAAPSFVPASWERPERDVRARSPARPPRSSRRSATLDSRHARVRVRLRRDLRRRARVPAAREHALPARTLPTRRQARRAPARRRAARRTTACTRARASSSTTSPSAVPSSSSRAGSRRAAAAISLGLPARADARRPLDAVRDWSFAGRRRARRVADAPAGAARATTCSRAASPHTVADLARAAFACVDLDAERYLRVDQALVRAAESTPSVGDPAHGARAAGLASRAWTSSSWSSAWCRPTCALQAARASLSGHVP